MAQPLNIGYRYLPLNPERREIRILIVKYQNVSDASPLQCYMEHISLLDEPVEAYTAFSYCWGDPNVRKPAIIDKHSVSIPESADTALRYSIGKSRWNMKMFGVKVKDRFKPILYRVWIDALCINQSDTEERNEQVRIMGDIYAAASRVCIWLGLDSSGLAKHADRAIERFRKRYIKDMKGNHLSKKRSPFDFSAEEWKGLNVFYSSPWFTRTWVIQENYLAKAVTCRIGSVIIHWAAHETLVGGLLNSNEFKMGVVRHMTSVPALGVERASRIESFRWRKKTLTNVLLMGSIFAASDPRDHVYGMLGIIENPATYGIEVDYNSSPKEVFISATRKAIFHDQSLLCLSPFYRREPPPNSPSTEQFPSWVTPFHWPFDRSATAIMGQEPPPEFESFFGYKDDGSESILTVRGVILDEIDNEPTVLIPFDTRAPPIDSPTEWSQDSIEYLCECSELAWTTARTCFPQMEEEKLLVKLSEALTPDLSASNPDKKVIEHERSENAKYFRSVMKHSIRGDLRELPETHLRTIPENMGRLVYKNAGRSLFSTVNERLGTAFPTARKGDKICYLFGAWHLLALRRENEHWILIGDIALNKGTRFEDVIELHEKGELEARAQWFDIA